MSTEESAWLSNLALPFANISLSESEDVYGSANDTFLGSLLSCATWSKPQHILFQLANACFFFSYVAPSQKKGLLFMHGLLIVGFLVYSMWAWNIICAPEVFFWNFAFVIINMGQMLHIIYQMRPVKIGKDLESLYKTLFQPLEVSRTLFKKLVSLEYAQIMTLHAGEAYAMQNLTRTDRLALLIAGKVNVMSDTHFLHGISPMEFLDSPEFESSRASHEDKFQIVTERGSHLDIRLPSLTSSLSSFLGTDGGSLKSPGKLSPRANSRINSYSNACTSPDKMNADWMHSTSGAFAPSGIQTKKGYSALLSDAAANEDLTNEATQDGDRPTGRSPRAEVNGFLTRHEMIPLSELPSTEEDSQDETADEGHLLKKAK